MFRNLVMDFANACHDKLLRRTEQRMGFGEQEHTEN